MRVHERMYNVYLIYKDQVAVAVSKLCLGLCVCVCVHVSVCLQLSFPRDRYKLDTGECNASTTQQYLKANSPGFLI